MHAERLLYSRCVPSLVLIAQAVFLLERADKQTYRQTDKQTDATERPTHADVYAGVDNKCHMDATFDSIHVRTLSI